VKIVLGLVTGLPLESAAVVEGEILVSRIEGDRVLIIGALGFELRDEGDVVGALV